MRLVRYTYPNYRTFTPALRSFSRSPWTGLESDIGRFFDAALTDLAGATNPDSRFPVDLYEDAENTYVRAELPGVTREAINVEVVDGVLNLSASRQAPAKEGQPEQSVTLNRSVTIPESVQSDRVTAAYENGVLTVTLPKREEPKAKKITVAVK